MEERKLIIQTVYTTGEPCGEIGGEDCEYPAVCKSRNLCVVHGASTLIVRFEQVDHETMKDMEDKYSNPPSEQ